MDQLIQLGILLGTIIPFLYGLHRQNVSRFEHHEAEDKKNFKRLRRLIKSQNGNGHNVGKD